ncbi:hypothetical protein [Conexibacter sp. SYSU D00693]|uniref:hypothetical protein n=1 Tax=Conexibacter sp. SYSU D00693 TaxID=2812560 RepID=UPI00196A3C05|nr:hypothetical protein [Conexibacter sp. SYSU D00693]
MRRPAACLLAALPALTLAACGKQSEPERVRSAVEGFAEATRTQDYQRICDDLLSHELVATVEEAGLPCELAVRRGLEGTKAPALEIQTIAVREGRASVGVRSTAEGQKPSDDVLELVREGDDWRISALAQPRTAPRR